MFKRLRLADGPQPKSLHNCGILNCDWIFSDWLQRISVEWQICGHAAVCLKTFDAGKLHLCQPNLKGSLSSKFVGQCGNGKPGHLLGSSVLVAACNRKRGQLIFWQIIYLQFQHIHLAGSPHLDWHLTTWYSVGVIEFFFRLKSVYRNEVTNLCTSFSSHYYLLFHLLENKCTFSWEDTKLMNNFADVLTFAQGF